MKKRLSTYCLFCVLLLMAIHASSQPNPQNDIEKNFLKPPASARPWVFWYWMHAAVSKEGITADLEAMKEVGIAGAYLMPIKDTSSAIPFKPVARQLSPEWWALVKFAMQEAKRLDLQLAMHVSDGFALAGGPWITPELSMQKLVWTKTHVKPGETSKVKLAQPETRENYYKDIAVFAYPANNIGITDQGMTPEVTTSNGTKANFLSLRGARESFRSDTACWIQYTYPNSFTCRSIQIHVGGNNYQAQRLIVQASDDGNNFKTITRLEPPRHGWQDTDEDYTYAIPATTSRYFRFVYDKQGSEPGAEDLDAAKWKPSFKVNGIYLGNEPVIHQYEAKNGSIWRVASNTTSQQVMAKDAVPLKRIIRLTGKMDKDGNLNWNPPATNTGWIIVRIGHTSTGHTNATGGAAKGLECDKFNPAAIKLQFDNWFAQAFVRKDSFGDKTDPALAKEVLKIFHVDSWECGSQNWSPLFANEFKKRRGYDLTPYLLAMTGVPVQDAATSEKFLHDIRQTIAELVNDVFYATLKKLAHEKGCDFSAESVAPTMVSDGLLHYSNTDIPMGEFWLNSPTHDKPNDMSDAISGAHIYGKNIIQAEAFTSVRMNWGEYPGNLKAIGDRNFALGINKMVLHVYTHNPWMDRKPGMTLDGVGLYFQRDQTWFKQSKAWIDYLARCQFLLQMGKPVVDIAVFTGEEVPRRSVLPSRLINTLPGIFGKEKLEEEKKRLANIGLPMRTIPDGVNHSANMADPEDWIDPLRGYAYDSFNPDALMKMTVKNGRIVLPGGASYAILVLPGKHSMQPNSKLVSLATAKKLLRLVRDGATIIISKDYQDGAGLMDKTDSVKLILKELFSAGNKKGRVIISPYTEPSFNKLGLPKDVDILTAAKGVAWTHRKTPGSDIYFISNQHDSARSINLSFKMTGMLPEIWDPVHGTYTEAGYWYMESGRTFMQKHMEANQSAFIVFRQPVSRKSGSTDARAFERIAIHDWVSSSWMVQFDTSYGGPPQPVIFDELTSWSEHSDPRIRFYSGTAVYSNTFTWNSRGTAQLVLRSVNNIATVIVNGINCGTLWTAPYEIDITKALREGMNEVKIEVTNTWANRLIGDHANTGGKRITQTTAPFRLRDKPLLPAGLLGRVSLYIK